MIKNRSVQLVYLTAACTVGLIGVLAGVGLFEAEFRWDFYIYFTNVSNYFCLAVMLLELRQVLRRGGDGYIDAHPRLKFMGLVSILLTFVMFNAVMAPAKSAEYLLSIRSISLHVIMPVLYLLDWLLFYERGKTDRRYPLIALILPISYFLFVLIHAAVLRFDSTILCFAGNAPLIYPYFFLDYEKYGIGGIVLWVVLIIAVLVAVGYLLYLLDRVLAKNRRSR